MSTHSSQGRVWPIIEEQDRAAVDAVLKRGVLYQGPEVPALEYDWATYTGCRHVIAAIESGIDKESLYGPRRIRSLAA